VSSLDDRSASQERWVFGVEGAFGGRVEVAPDLFIVGDLEAAGLSAATGVSVFGASIGESSAFRYLASFGLRVRLR
jgi:hypothetical protein